MKAYCNPGTVCTVFNLKAALMARVSYWRLYQWSGCWHVFRFPHQFLALKWASLDFREITSGLALQQNFFNSQIFKRESEPQCLVHLFPAVVGKIVTSLLSSSNPGSWEALGCCSDRSDTPQAAQLSQAQAETYLYMALTRILCLSLTAFFGFLNVQQFLYLQINQVPRGRWFSEV